MYSLQKINEISAQQGDCACLYLELLKLWLRTLNFASDINVLIYDKTIVQIDTLILFPSQVQNVKVSTKYYVHTSYNYSFEEVHRNIKLN
jgi:hypothetical protein